MSYQQLTKISPAVERALDNLMQQYAIDDCLERIYRSGGRVFLVGGAVRDLILDRPVIDVDLEVHGVTLEQLEQLLQQEGPVSLVGKSFGVLRIARIPIDWSVPRTDSKGRKPAVICDPNMDPVQAFERRDLTMNAMGIDLKTKQLFDPFNGMEALREKRLSTPNDRLFVEDPLRFFRVMQSVGRFEMRPDAQLNHICSIMDITSISRERIAHEFEKLLLLSRRPSLGFRWLQEVGRLQQIVPELYATIGVVQDPRWHPEGDVFEHTMQALDAAAALTYESSAQALKIMWATVCHDLGKVTTTQIEHDKITSRNHAQAGVALSRAMLKRVVLSHELIAAVERCVLYHMAPVEFVTQGAKLPAYKRLARKLHPLVTMQELAMVSLADKRGRNPNSHEPLHTTIEEIEQFLTIAARAGVIHQPENAILTGADLMGHVAPGPLMGKMLERAYELQIAEGITSKDELRNRVLAESSHEQR